MHELSIVESLLEMCESQALDAQENKRRIAKAVVAVGSLSCVEPEALRFCFDACKAGTQAEGATLEIELEAGKGQCEHCGACFAVSELHMPCACGAFDYSITGGDGLVLKILEFEA